MPGNIMKAMGNEDDLRSGLDAALTPAVASAPENQGIMEQMWNQIVEPAQSSIAAQLSAASDQARTAADDAVYQQVSAAVQAQVDAGALPADQAQTFIDAQVAESTPAAEEAALASTAEQAHASVQDGTLVVDWSDKAQRSYWVDQLTPTLAEQISSTSTDGEESGVSTSDTSYLTGADARLTRPFMVGFNASTLSVYWVGFFATVLALVLALFFKTPPLRAASGLHENAQGNKQAEDAAEPHAEVAERDVLEVQTVYTGSIPVVEAVPETEKAQVSVEVAEQKPAVSSESQAEVSSSTAEAAPAAPARQASLASGKKPRAGVLAAVAAGTLALGAALFSWLRRRSR